VRSVLFKTKETIQNLKDEVNSKELTIEDLKRMIKLESEEREKDHRDREQYELRERETREREQFERSIREQTEREREKSEQIQKENREKAKLEREQLEKEKREKVNREQLEKEKREREKHKSEKFEKEKIECKKNEFEKFEKEKREREKREIEQVRNQIEPEIFRSKHFQLIEGDFSALIEMYDKDYHKMSELDREIVLQEESQPIGNDSLKPSLNVKPKKKTKNHRRYQRK